ncbi:hypothetical protein KEJ15_05255 [Candidatus Bathyarchaeota archaeon]|nr:hypothetical protein [Candidatus Bathyarchaeota archaeon]
MVKCPKCGGEKATVVKTWSLPTRKTAKEEEATPVVGIFECLNCKARFRSMVEKEVAKDETASIKNMVERIRGIREELVQTLKNLREKIKTLETERSNLIIEIESLKKVAESRVSALQSEVNILREEVKSLRDVLGYVEEAETQ